jgi:hypothetical protein
LRASSQFLLPVVKLLLSFGPQRRLLLPHNVITKLKVKRRQRRRLAIRERRVNLGEFIHEHPDRPAVTDDLMKSQSKNESFILYPQKVDA